MSINGNLTNVARRFWATFCGVAVLAAATIFNANAWGGVVIKRAPTLYVLAVGVDSGTTSGCENDATALAQTLYERGEELFGVNDVVVKTLLGKDFDKKNLREAFAEIAAEAEPDDVFFFSFAGQGGAIDAEGQFVGNAVKFNDAFYALTTRCAENVANASDREDVADVVRAYGISSETFGDLINSVETRRRIAIFDSCCSASTLGAIDGCVVAVDGVAVEILSRKNAKMGGALTASLLDGIDVSRREDGALDVCHWFYFAQKETAKRVIKERDELIKERDEFRGTVVFRIDEEPFSNLKEGRSSINLRSGGALR